MKNKPNIVLLMTDQQKAGAAGIYGNPIVDTPFQDDMAQKGVRFTNAYTNASICTPSRATMMTGVQPLVHDCSCHQNRVPFNLPQLSELLQQEGYYTAAAGHYEPLRNLDRGWHEQSDMSEPGPLYQAWNKHMNLGRRDVGWSSGKIDVSDDQGHSALLTNRVIRMLDNIRAADRPYFLHVAYNDPHPPYFVPPPYDSMYDIGSIPLPPQGSAGKPKWQYRCMEECGTGLASPEEIKKVVSVYYGMITYANHQMERLYQAMKDRGMLENTWFILTSDHGDYTGEKGLFNKTESLYECLLHIPLIITPPAGTEFPSGKAYNDFADMTDLFATVLGLTDTKIPGYVQGKDLVSWINRDGAEPLRDKVYAQVGNYRGGLKTTFPGGMAESGRHPSLVQGVRNHRYSYIKDPDYGDEAYNLEEDPYELENLFGRQEKIPDEVLELMKAAREWERECLTLKNRIGIIPGDRGFYDGLLQER